jgi:hypothetical protein
MTVLEDFNNLTSEVRVGINTRSSLEEKISNLRELSNENMRKVQVLTGAKQLLSVVSEEALDNTVTYITSIVNKVLNDMFEGTGNTYSIKLTKELYRKRYTHVNLNLYEDGNERDFKISTGMGIRQVISFLYVMCLIEESGRRKFVVLDEVLSNLNPEAAECVGAIIKIFAKGSEVNGGFQFFMIDHGNFDENSVLDPYIQRINIRKIDKVSTVVSGNYSDEDE